MTGDLSKSDSSRTHKWLRVYLRVVNAHFEMRMAAGRGTCTSNFGNRLAGRDRLTLTDEDCAVMRVPRLDAIAMIDQDPIAVGAIPAGRDNCAVGGGGDRLSAVSCDVGSLVEITDSSYGLVWSSPEGVTDET